MRRETTDEQRTFSASLRANRHLNPYQMADGGGALGGSPVMQDLSEKSGIFVVIEVDQNHAPHVNIIPILRFVLSLSIRAQIGSF